MAELKIAGPWQVDMNNRARKDAAGRVIATVIMDTANIDAYEWRAGTRHGVESASSECYVNHAVAVRKANAALIEQGYTLFETVAVPNPEAERKEWARAYKANEDVWLIATLRQGDPAAERNARSKALQALRDLGVDVDALLGFTAD